MRVCWNVFSSFFFIRTTEIFEYSFGCDTTSYVFHSEGEFQDCLLKSYICIIFAFSVCYFLQFPSYFTVRVVYQVSRIFPYSDSDGSKSAFGSIKNRFCVNIYLLPDFFTFTTGYPFSLVHVSVSASILVIF